jgi:cytochrome c oxidase subunit II
VSAQLQSVLSPAGQAARNVSGMSWVLIGGAALIFAGVMGLLVWSLRQRASGQADRIVSKRLWLLGGGVVFPAVVLLALLVWSTARTPGWLAQPPPGALIVGITAHLWWWEIRLREPVSGVEVTLANELHLPTDRPVWLGLSSRDVIHSFWVPALAGKMDMVPGRTNHLLVQADKTGVYRGQCAEFCGEQHARMALHVVAEPPAAFDAWLAAQAKPAATSLPNTVVERGQGIFLAQRCNACHTVRGVAEEGRLGPDLTHVGSRLFIGAGTLTNQPGQLAHWVAHTQDIKPGARMPSSNDMDTATLQALGAWLESLK